jgi:hypothetical protein
MPSLDIKKATVQWTFHGTFFWHKFAFRQEGLPVSAKVIDGIKCSFVLNHAQSPFGHVDSFGYFSLEIDVSAQMVKLGFGMSTHEVPVFKIDFCA